jgi:hypothetical protein
MSSYPKVHLCLCGDAAGRGGLILHAGKEGHLAIHVTDVTTMSFCLAIMVLCSMDHELVMLYVAICSSIM